jgi:hypothetical protein
MDGDLSTSPKKRLRNPRSSAEWRAHSLTILFSFVFKCQGADGTAGNHRNGMRAHRFIVHIPHWQNTTFNPHPRKSLSYLELYATLTKDAIYATMQTWSQFSAWQSYQVFSSSTAWTFQILKYLRHLLFIVTCPGITFHWYMREGNPRVIVFESCSVSFLWISDVHCDEREKVICNQERNVLTRANGNNSSWNDLN